MPKLALFDRLGHWLARLVVGRPRTVIAVSLALMATLGFGLRWAQFSTDYRLFFSQEDPGLMAFQRLERAFTKTDNVLFVVHAAQGSLYDREPLAAVQALTAAGWKLPHATRVDSLTNYQHATATGDDIRVGALVPMDAGHLSDAELAGIRDVATHEPLLFGSLVSRDGRTAAVNVTIRLPGSDPAEVAKVADAARALVTSVGQRFPTLDIRPSGMVFVNDAFMQASVVDMGRMIPLMCVVMLLGMLFIVKSKPATAALATCIAASAAGSMAVAGWLGYPLTPTSVAAPIIVLTVAIADGVHIVLSVMGGLRAGRERANAVAHAIEHHLEAVTYTWLTTIVGFLCLNYSDAPPVRHLANMTSVGVTVAYLLSITFLPALLVVLPVRAPKTALRGGLHIPTWLPNAVIRWRKPILGLTAVVTIATAVMAMRLETNDLFIQYFSPQLQFRKDADFTMKHLSGLYRVEFLLDAGAPAGVTEPRYLHDVERFTAWLRTQSEVDHVYSVTDIVRRVHQVASGGAVADYMIPNDKRMISEDLLLYEMNLPAGLDLTDRISVDKSSTRLSITIKDLSTRQLNAFVARTESWLQHHAPKPMWARATGPVVIFSQMSERNAKNMVQADFLSLGIILLCMVVLLRSWSLGIVSVILNVVPIVMGYGIWWLVVGDMNIVATIAASISLGIIVDDTIHFLTKFRQLRKEGGTAEAAIKETMIEAGPAMMATGLILCMGFGVLTLSSFQMTSHLGWLSLIIIAIAPLTDLFLTPALVMFRERSQSRRSSRLENPIAVSGHLGSGQWIVEGGIES